MPALYYIYTFSATTATGCHNIMVIFFKEYNYIQQYVVLYAYRNDGWCWNIVELETGSQYTKIGINIALTNACDFNKVQHSFYDFSTLSDNVQSSSHTNVIHCKHATMF